MPESPTDELRRALLCALPLLALEQSAKAQDAAKIQPRATVLHSRTTSCAYSITTAAPEWGYAETVCTRIRRI
jgi:hypothetical protein